MNKFSAPRWWRVFLGGLFLISLGFASSVGLKPVEALAPLAAVVGGLVVLTSFAGSGPRAFM
jgi:hypothetical protein